MSTSIHKDEKTRMICSLFGLLGELDELEDKIVNMESTELIIKELGDVFWYLALLSHCLETVPTDAYVNYNIATPISEVAKMQEIYKKAIRDNDGVLTSIQKDKLRDHVNVLYSLLLYTINKLKLNLSDVLNTNLEKLRSRKERNVISGSGDER
jgi:NTP pyrophosphatase (non-canonical NTP hydrolase)